MPDLPAGLDRIRDLLACPWCGAAALASAGDDFGCPACKATFPVRDGIADLARRGTAETWGAEAAEASSAAYQAQYADPELARGYDRMYRVYPLKRLTTLREKSLLRRHLASQDRCGTLLELPCGGGRLSPTLAPFTDLLIQADVGWGQLLHAQRATDGPGDRVLLAASAFHVPFVDSGVDGVVCVRLSHHLPTREERERLVRELLRVARRFVVMTFFDERSLKNRIRRWQGKPPKLTMTVEEVAGLAREGGAELAAAPMLSPVGSGHRHALLVKRAG